MKRLLLAALLCPLLITAQTNPKDSLWIPFKLFIGEWVGEGGGDPGTGKYERSYAFVLNNNFIEIKNKSTYAPTEKYPAGEVHEDIGYFSYDKILKQFMLRQFHAEGFVNEYALDSISPSGKTIVFTTIRIENIPAGWRARETYRLTGENEMEELFELAEPGKEFTTYSKTLFRRK